MATFLFAPVPFTGHVSPGLPIAKELVKRGHKVVWYSSRRFQGAIERIGGEFVPMKRAMELDEEGLDLQFPGRSRLRGLPQLKHDLHHVFLDQIPALLEDLLAEAKEHSVDVMVGDSVSGVCGLVSERLKLKWAVYGITVLIQSSVDAPPFGLGQLPSQTLLGPLRHRVLNWSMEHVVFSDVMAHYRRLRKELGYPHSDLGMFEFTRAADVFLQGSIPAFEYPRRDLPQNVRFIGAFLPETPADWQPPSWWGSLSAERPTILVTQGTIASDLGDLIRPAIRALAGSGCNVVVTTGSKPVETVGIDPVPSNVQIEQFVPYGALMPRVDLLLTNGGYGSIQIALAHGVPVVVFGASEDKAEIANRVRWSGVGVGLKKKRPTEVEIRVAVKAVLEHPSYKKHAQAFKAELAKYDAAKLSGDYLEALLGPSVVAASVLRTRR